MTAIQFESKLVCRSEYNQALKNAMIVICGSLLLAISAQITIPLQPVPITLQSFAALFVGMAFGPRVGSQIIFAYLCEGICGLPVFANFSSGVHVLFGPTGGYLLGFIPEAILAGYLLEIGWAKSRLTIFLSAAIGIVALFIPSYFILAKFVGFRNAYIFGVLPFYLVEMGKLFIFTVITPFFWQRKTAK
jgi:biotin transport system substrate-specific component